eukprot:2896712-Prymnesium_polylepis.1
MATASTAQRKESSHARCAVDRSGSPPLRPFSLGLDQCRRGAPLVTPLPRGTRSAPPELLDDDGLAARGEGERRVPVSYTHLTLPTICSV